MVITALTTCQQLACCLLLKIHYTTSFLPEDNVTFHTVLGPSLHGHDADADLAELEVRGQVFVSMQLWQLCSDTSSHSSVTLSIRGAHQVNSQLATTLTRSL